MSRLLDRDDCLLLVIDAQSAFYGGTGEPDGLRIALDRAAWLAGVATGLGVPAESDPPDPPTILFVGRLAPHKRQDAVIRAFELYRRRHRPDARLVLVGAPINQRYEAAMRALAGELSPGHVTIESGLTAEQLAGRWRSAHAFLCLSEHEGFCVPLLEAMTFGIPVVAYDAGAVAETLRGGGVLLKEKRPEVVAELLHTLRGDPALRRSVLATQERALRELRAVDFGALLMDRLSPVLETRETARR